MIIALVIIGAVAGIFYRLGGTKWGTLWRDAGVPLCMILFMTLIGHWHWSLILCGGAMWGALTTYRYFLPKPTNYKWFHYAMHGFFIALAMLPIVWFNGNWFWFGGRVVACTGLVSLWSHLIGWDDLEEWGRGFIIIATLPLLFL